MHTFVSFTNGILGNATGSNALISTENVSIEMQKVNENDQEIQQSHTAGQPTAP